MCPIGLEGFWGTAGDTMLCDMILGDGGEGKEKGGKEKRKEKQNKKKSPINFQTTAKNKAKALIWGGAGRALRGEALIKSMGHILWQRYNWSIGLPGALMSTMCVLSVTAGIGMAVCPGPPACPVPTDLHGGNPCWVSPRSRQPRLKPGGTFRRCP